MQTCETEYRDNRAEFKRRLVEDLKLPKDEFTECLSHAVAYCVDHGIMEVELLADKYADLICPWCGHLHYRAICQEQSEKYQSDQAKK